MNRHLPLMLAVTWSISVAAACSDRGATAPGPVPGGFAAAITCQATVRTPALSCGPSSPAAAPGLNASLILGGQDTLVHLAGSGVTYSGGIWSANVTVQNLTAQPMATADGTNPDTGGIKVFIHSGPDVPSGPQVTVHTATADGSATFTGTDQPYWKYSGIVAPNGVSGSRTWQFDAGPDQTFTFQVYVTTTLPADASVLLWVNFPSPTGETLRSIRMNCCNPATGWAVGDNGTILHYNGTSWSTVSTGLVLGGVNLYGVDASGGGAVYIVGDGGKIVYSPNDGANWSFQSSGVPTALFSVQRVSQSSAVYAVGENGVILYSADGTTWGPRETGVEILTDSLFITGGPADNNFFAGGEGGTALHWNGTTWSPLSLVTGASIHSGDGTGDFTGLTHIWLVGTGGTIADSAFGVPWSTQAVGAQDLFGIRANNQAGTGATDVMAVGSAGRILHWNGVSWSAMASGTTADLKAIDTGDFSGSFTEWWAVGSGGKILHGIR